MTDSPRTPDRLPSYALFAGILAAAGLPIYINAPKFYFDEYGVSLATLGFVLFGLRLLDVVQDPFLGWLSGLLGKRRAAAVGAAGVLMGASMLGVFAVTPPIAPLLWFTLTLALLFSSFSFLTITFYAQGVAKVASTPHMTHVRVATWRETGGLIGVCLAAIAPTLLLLISPDPFKWFAVLFFAVTIAALVAMRHEWLARDAETGFAFGAILREPGARRLLFIAFANAAPVAVTSTLFLFFTQYRLEAPGSEGPLLLLFFLSAAISAPFWGKAAAQFGLRTSLIAGMILAIVTFSYAAFLGAGDVIPFAIVCVLSGAALGADMTLLPAAFAAQVSRTSGHSGQAFGLWNFVSKLTLAIAVVTVLPVLEAAGLTAEVTPTAGALTMLTVLYAVVPGLLKLIAITLLLTAPKMAAFQGTPHLAPTNT